MKRLVEECLYMGGARGILRCICVASRKVNFSALLLAIAQRSPGFAGSHGAEASGDGHGEGDAKPKIKGKTVELKLLDFRAPNKQSGRTFLYDVSIFVVTKTDHEEKVKSTIESRTALITDRVRTIIAQSDPEKLGGGSEPGLETLRRQVKYQLDEIVGEGMISEVLVPRCIPFRTDY